MTYQVKDNQSLFDVAIEVYGDVQGINWLLEDNPTLPGPCGPVEAGQKLVVRATALNARQQDFLDAFAPFQTIEDAHFPTGIGYWKLEQYAIT